MPISTSSSTASFGLTTTLGASYIGLCVATFLFGISTLQAYNYYESFPRDRKWLKGLVAFIWVGDLLHSFFLAYANYQEEVTNFGSVADLAKNSWSAGLTICFTEIVACACQAFFIGRLWILGRNAFITGICAVLCMLRLVFGLLVTYVVIRWPDVLEEGSHFGWSTPGVLIVGTIGDILIACCLVYYLLRGKTFVGPTERIVQRLIIFTIETCIATSSVTLATTICHVTLPHSAIFSSLYNIVAKLYTNAVLTSLNARTHLRNISARGTAVDFDERGVSRQMPVFASWHSEMRAPSGTLAEAAKTASNKSGHASDVEPARPSFFELEASGDGH